MHLPTAEHTSRAYIASLALLTVVFALYVAVIAASTLGFSPLASRAFTGSILSLGLGLGAWVVWRKARGGSQPRPLRACFARLGGRFDAGSRRVERQPEPKLGRGLQRVAFGGALMGLVATGLGLLLALLLPVGAYDALGYRLPAVVQWLDAGAVTWLSGDDPLRNGYPLALEVIEALTFRALGSAALVDCVAPVFLLAGAAALAGYARRLGVGRPLAALAAGLFLLVPMHLLNAPSGYADAAFAGCLVLLFVAHARWVETDRASYALLAELGMASALAVALKPHGFAFAGVALACAGALRFRAHGVRRAALELGAVAALAMPGLFFALRNLRHTGNPLYPLELRIAGHVLLRGRASLETLLTPDYNVPAQLGMLPSWLRPFWVWLQPYGPARSFDDRLAGLGYAFVLLGLPALAWLTLRAVRLRREQPGLGLFLGLTSLCWVLQPLSFWARFTSWLWGAAALALAVSIAALSESGRGRTALALASCSLLIALPEALYALQHVKRLDRFGLRLLCDDPLTQLVRVSGVNASFVQTELVGQRDVCRTAWRLGTDDANLDGVVAQLEPRPRMHVISSASLPEQLTETRALGCRELIVIGDNPMLGHPTLTPRIARATAFGTVHLVPVMSAEVIP